MDIAQVAIGLIIGSIALLVLGSLWTLISLEFMGLCQVSNSWRIFAAVYNIYVLTVYFSMDDSNLWLVAGVLCINVVACWTCIPRFTRAIAQLLLSLD